MPMQRATGWVMKEGWDRAHLFPVHIARHSLCDEILDQDPMSYGKAPDNIPKCAWCMEIAKNIEDTQNLHAL